MRRRLWIALVGMAVVGVGCSDDENPNIPWPDGGPEEASIFLDSTTQDLGQVPDGLPVDPEGPTIEVLVPAEDEIVIGTVLKVRASVTDSDGVDDQSVEVTLQGSQGEYLIGLVSVRVGQGRAVGLAYVLDAAASSDELGVLAASADSLLVLPPG